MEQEKKVCVMGLTTKQWKEYDELLARANKEQIERFITIAGLKLTDKKVVFVDKEFDDLAWGKNESN